MTYPPAPPAPTTPPAAPKTRPGSVTTAAWLQILLGLFLIAQSVVGFVYGADAADAAEAELEAQGFGMSDMPEGTTFETGGVTSFIPIVFALLLIVLAVLNNAGKRPARLITWIAQPLVLICGGFLAVSQLFLAQFIQAGIDSTGGPEDLDVQAVVDAMYGAFPAWTTFIDYGVYALATLGSIAVIILLAVPSANAYFRKEETQTYIPGAPPA